MPLNNNNIKKKIVGLKFACHKVTWGFENIRHKKSIRFDKLKIKIFIRYK